MHGGGGFNTDEKWVFVWLEPLMWKGFSTTLQMEDIPELAKSKKVSYVYAKYLSLWEFFGKSNLKLIKKNRLIITIYTLFGFDFIFSGVLMILFQCLQIAIPTLMKEFLERLRPLVPDEFSKFQKIADNVLPPEMADGFDTSFFRQNDYEAWIFLVLTATAYIFSFFFRILSMHISSTMGMKQRAVLSLAMYEKSLKLSNKSRATFDNGTIINYISTDTMRAERINMMFHYGWTSVIVFVGAIYFLIDLVDWGAMSVCLTPVVYSPLILLLMVVVIILQKKSVKITDSRVKRMNEFLQGIKIIKFYAWEEAYTKVITKIRGKEVKFMLLFSFFIAVFMTLFFSTPQIMAIAAYLTFFLVHGYLDPITIFTSLNYINLIQGPVTMFPMTLMGLVETMVSLGRMQRLLEAEELSVRKVEEFDETVEDVITVKNATFKWEAIKKEEEKKERPKSLSEIFKRIKEKKEQKKKEKMREIEGVELDEKPFELENVNLDLKRGQLIMIVGKVGSGKSSLLAGILSEMKMTTGNVKILGNVAYCAQNAWIMNATLLDNVIFGKPMDEDQFEEVVQVVGLASDIAMLKGGRMIEIGEKGINLSGGQRTRVSLARCAYSKADVYLLDDPLAAVDAHVGKHIFDECIKKYLAGKTRVLVTHQIHLCEQADYIVYLDDGEITETGTYKDLMSNEKGFFKLISENLAKKDENEEEIVKKIRKKIKVEKTYEKHDLIVKEEKAKGVVGFDVIQSYIKACGGWWVFILIMMSYVIVQLCLSGSQWFLSEWSNGTFNEEFGNVYNSPVYVNISVVPIFNLSDPMPIPIDYEMYISNTNYSLESLFNMSGGTEGFAEMSDLFDHIFWYDRKKYLKLNPEKTYNGTDCVFESSLCFELPVEVIWDMTYNNGTRIKDGMKQTETLSIYAASGIGALILAFVRDIIFASFCLLAAKRLHDGALKSVSNAPMSFFDTTPIGRILNRFSADFLTLDMLLVRVVSMVIFVVFMALGMFGLMGYATDGLFLPFLIPVLFLYGFFYVIYRKTAIELKRLFSVSRSPLLAHVSETLNGTQTIRAYGRVDEFLQENRKRIDVNNTTYYLMRSSMRWLLMRLQFVGFFVIVSVCSLCTILMYYFEDQSMTNISYIAMGVSYSFMVSVMMSMMFMQLTEAEVMFNSVERVNHYQKNVEQEKPRHLKGDDDAGPDWPRSGSIQFNGYYMRYRDNLPMVLRDVNLDIKTGERIGVVGRTGSGKSSLMIAVFRLVEPLAGSILIDGVDISTLGTHKLRKSISIIPQEPTLFMGTIRSNLDPFDNHSDEDINNALRRASLEKCVERIGGLKGTVVAGGENFSAGERQLLCLARALLKKSKLLILDECTASVDVESDRIIQKSIRENKESTILTIAHRLNTIIDYDRILVMDNGEVAEFDTPKNLLSMEKYSIFRELVEETGASNAKFLLNQLFGHDFEQHVVNTRINDSFIESSFEIGFGERIGFPGLFDEKACSFHVEDSFEVEYLVEESGVQLLKFNYSDFSSVSKMVSGGYVFFEVVIEEEKKIIKILKQALHSFSELFERKIRGVGVKLEVIEHFIAPEKHIAEDIGDTVDFECDIGDSLVPGIIKLGTAGCEIQRKSNLKTVKKFLYEEVDEFTLGTSKSEEKKRYIFRFDEKSVPISIYIEQEKSNKFQNDLVSRMADDDETKSSDE